MAQAINCLDIDDFKHLSDTYGHLFGDHALKHPATLLLQTTRRIDIVGRYGGEEFVILLPQTSEETALEVTERVCRTVAATAIAHEDAL